MQPELCVWIYQPFFKQEVHDGPGSLTWVIFPTKWILPSLLLLFQLVASFNPRGIIWIELINVHKAMLHTKNQSSKPSRFREEEFWILPSLFLCSNLWPHGGANLDPRGIVWTLGRGQQWDAAYKISKLYAFHFQRRRILNMGFFVSMFQLVAQPGEASFDPRDFIWTNLVEVYQKMLHT